MKNNSSDKIDRLYNSLKNDMAILGELAELCRQEASGLAQIEAEEREILVDIEHGGPEGIQRAIDRLKASFGLK